MTIAMKSFEEVRGMEVTLIQIHRVMNGDAHQFQAGSYGDRVCSDLSEKLSDLEETAASLSGMYDAMSLIRTLIGEPTTETEAKILDICEVWLEPEVDG